MHRADCTACSYTSAGNARRGRLFRIQGVTGEFRRNAPARSKGATRRGRNCDARHLAQTAAASIQLLPLLYMRRVVGGRMAQIPAAFPIRTASNCIQHFQKPPSQKRTKRAEMVSVT